MTAKRSMPRRHSDGTASRSLMYAAICFALGMGIHSVDHAFRGFMAEEDHAVWPGGVQIAIAAIVLALPLLTVALVRSGHRHSPVVAMVVGYGSAAAFLLIHLPPEWRGINDSFVSAEAGSHVTAYSWVTALVGIAGSLWLGVAGTWARRRESPS